MDRTVAAMKNEPVSDREIIRQHLTRKISTNTHEQYLIVIVLVRISWNYKTSGDLKGSSTSGLISRYGGGGYVQDFTTNYPSAKEQLDELKSKLWLNRGTRAVLLDFTVYNANINLFCQIKLMVEFPASGGAVPSKSFSTVKLIRVCHQ
jgi:hypothetical protein